MLLFSFVIPSGVEGPRIFAACQWHLPSGESLPRALPKGQRVPTRRMRALAPIQLHRLHPLPDSNSLSRCRERVRVRDICAAQLSVRRTFRCIPTASRSVGAGSAAVYGRARRSQIFFRHPAAEGHFQNLGPRLTYIGAVGLSISGGRSHGSTR